MEPWGMTPEGHCINLEPAPVFLPPFMHFFLILQIFTDLSTNKDTLAGQTEVHPALRQHQPLVGADVSH